MSEPEEIIQDFNGSSDEDKLFITVLEEKGFSRTEIATFLQAMGEVCNECWNRPRNCYCHPRYDI